MTADAYDIVSVLVCGIFSRRSPVGLAPVLFTCRFTSVHLSLPVAACRCLPLPAAACRAHAAYETHAQLLTRLGRKMAEFPLEPQLSKMLITR